MDVNVADDGDISFQLGELFNSYEELENKLERFSKHSLVHYWRRDSRTVSGAHMKTARPISERLKYYSVKYACIYGGQKFLPRGAGRRQSQSIRTNCPAHIMLRASKDGTKLEVTSVNNDHNHEISEELFKKLPQERKLCGEIKQEVQDLMAMHIDRKLLKEYVRLRTNKILRSKDLFNIAAANKEKRKISKERQIQLLQRMDELKELQHRENGESEDEISQTIKRIKTEQSGSPWGQEELSSELEVNEANDCEDSYSQMPQEEVVDDIDTTESELLTANTEGDIIAANGEIVGELVMEGGDPSVIVESIVNTDESVFVDEREFNNYCNNHLNHQVHDNHSPDSQDLNMNPISSSVRIEKISKAASDSAASSEHLETLTSHINIKSTRMSQKSDRERIWITAEAENENCLEDENPIPQESKDGTTDNSGDVEEVIFSDESNPHLLIAQLAVLKAEKGKLYHETEMLKLKKDKLKLQISCYTNEIRKQEMEKEKLRLEIKLLQSKLVDDANDVSLIFVP